MFATGDRRSPITRKLPSRGYGDFLASLFRAGMVEGYCRGINGRGDPCCFRFPRSINRESC